MIDHIFLFFYIITVGVTFSVSTLSFLYWLKKKSSGRLHTFLFISYLAFLLLLSGIRFYWEELLSGGSGVRAGTELAEMAGYSLLLYFLPATVNHIINLEWSGLRLWSAVTASIIYFILGTVNIFTGSLKPLSYTAVGLYVIAMIIIIINILRSIPLIKKLSIRITVLLVTIMTIIFLPIILLSRLLGENIRQESYSIRFLMLSLYYFWMAVTGIVFYILEMTAAVNNTEIEAMTIKDNLPLTEREKDIAFVLTKGYTYQEIAESLEISPNTVRNHVANIYKKLSVRSKMELISVLKGERDY